MAAKKKKTADQKNRRSKIISILVMTVIVVFVLGHLSAVLNARADAEDTEVLQTAFLEVLLQHIRTKPLGLEINPYVAYFGGLSYLLGFVLAFSKQVVPSAEMKGIEHGSNDFQTAEERQDFLDTNTSEIFEMDLSLIQKNIELIK